MSRRGSFHRAGLLAAVLAGPAMAWAQSVAVPAGSAHDSMESADMESMDMGAMPGMTMPASSSSAAKPATAAGNGADSMPGMDHGAMAHGERPVTHHAARAAAAEGQAPMNLHAPAPMAMGAMQGGRAPAAARSPDYSDGIGYGPMAGMDMADGTQSMLLVDRLEAAHSHHANGQGWEAEGWYGGDIDKLWLRSEGERTAGRLERADAEMFWNHAVSAFWSSQLGLRHDVGVGPTREWEAFGIEGLAPNWFELQATGYVGGAGRTAARLQADYDLRFTQRLVLRPELELDAYGKSDPARRLGRGIAEVRFGLRLRYEISRQFAPYIGVNWVRRTGISAGYARDDHRPVLDRQIVAGLRFWF